jgi:hypothetical protein
MVILLFGPRAAVRSSRQPGPPTRLLSPNVGAPAGRLAPRGGPHAERSPGSRVGPYHHGRLTPRAVGPDARGTRHPARGGVHGVRPSHLTFHGTHTDVEHVVLTLHEGSECSSRSADGSVRGVRRNLLAVDAQVGRRGMSGGFDVEARRNAGWPIQDAPSKRPLGGGIQT